MTCRELQALLGDLRAREASGWTRARVALHAAGCPCCRAMMRSYDLVVDVAGELGDVEIPAALAEDVRRLLADARDKT